MPSKKIEFMCEDCGHKFKHKVEEFVLCPKCEASEVSPAEDCMILTLGEGPVKRKRKPEVWIASAIPVGGLHHDDPMIVLGTSRADALNKLCDMVSKSLDVRWEGNMTAKWLYQNGRIALDLDIHVMKRTSPY